MRRRYRTKRDPTAAFSTIERESAKMGLAVNEVKTKYMKIIIFVF